MQNIIRLIGNLQTIVASVVPLLIGFGLVIFIWSLTRYILKTDDKEGREGARNIMVWGVASLFVIVGLWGFVNFLISIFFGTGGGNSSTQGVRTELPSFFGGSCVQTRSKPYCDANGESSPGCCPGGSILPTTNTPTNPSPFPY